MKKHVEIRQAGRTIAVPECVAILEAAFANVVAKNLQEFDGWKAYVAGPPPMVEAAMLICRAGGCVLRTFMSMCSLRRQKHRRAGKPPGFSGGI